MGRVADGWNSLGRFISGHTAYIAPLAIITGIIAAPILGPIRPIVPTLFALMTFQGSLRIQRGDLGRALRHPLAAIVIIGVVLVVMPLIATAAAHLLFPGQRDVAIGAIIEFSEPIAAMAFIWIEMASGSLVLGLVVILITSVATPFTMPLTMDLLLGEAVELDSLGIMLEMLYMVAVPSVVGMALNMGTNGWGERVVAPKLFTVARLCFVTVLATNATALAPYLRELTWTSLWIALFILGLCILGFILGLLVAKLLPASRPERVTISYTCGMRNISVGAVIAADYFSPTAVFTVIIAVLYQQILAALFRQLLIRLALSPPEHS